MKPVAPSEIEHAYAEGVYGRFAAADELLSRLATSPDPTAQMWGIVLRAQRWLAQPSHGAEPSIELASSALSAEAGTRRVAGIVCSLGCRIAWLAFDRERFDAWHSLHERLTVSDSTDESELWLLAERAQGAVFDSDAVSARDHAASLATVARASEKASLVIEATVLRALAAMTGGELEEATALARRASRMARAEGRPQQEYLANIVLARMRRLTGKPHLSVFILGALANVASPAWANWIQWELDCSREALPLPDEPALSSPASVLRAAASGSRERFDRAVEECARRAHGFGHAQEDVECLATLLDVYRAAESPRDRLWLEGLLHEVPLGLHGVASADESGVVAYVTCLGGTASRRILSTGANLVALQSGAVIVDPSAQARTDSTIAALLLAGEAGFEEDTLFRDMYGFDYAPNKHRGVRTMLYKRIRERLEGLGELLREEGQVSLRLGQTLIFPDPRCTAPGEHALLRLLARMGKLSAKDAAERLGIPVRTAQHALRQLAEDGACSVARKGRAHEYRIEDTTFCEPTVI